MTERLHELETLSQASDFWNDMERSQKILTEQKQLKEKTTAFKGLYAIAEEAEMLAEMAEEEGGEGYESELSETQRKLEHDLEKQNLETLLNGEYDANNAILTFHAGAGGTEAQDWALMLFRMYSRYGEQNDFKIKVVDMLDGDEAG